MEYDTYQWVDELEEHAIGEPMSPRRRPPGTCLLGQHSR